MSTRKKLLLGALGFVAATTTIALWQATPPKIERIARLVEEHDAWRALNLDEERFHRSKGHSDLEKISWAAQTKENRLVVRPEVLAGRTEAEIKSWMLSASGQNLLVILHVDNLTFPEQETIEFLFHHRWPRAQREFWLVSRDGKKSRCLATDDVSNIPDGDSFWRILSWSPDGKRVLLSCQGGLSMESRVYLLEL